MLGRQKDAWFLHNSKSEVGQKRKMHGLSKVRLLQRCSPHKPTRRRPWLKWGSILAPDISLLPFVLCPDLIRTAVHLQFKFVTLLFDDFFDFYNNNRVEPTCEFWVFRKNELLWHRVLIDRRSTAQGPKQLH